MDNSGDIIDLLDILYGMVTEAWSVPLGNDKCIIEREKAVQIINDIKACLPTAMAESKRLVAARDDFIGSAKREAEALRKNAEEQARTMIEEQEIIRVSRAKSAEMMAAAEAKSKELRRVASEYVENIIRQSEESMSAALANIQNVRKAFALSGANSPDMTSEAPVAPNRGRAPQNEPTRGYRPTSEFRPAEEYRPSQEYGPEQEYGYSGEYRPEWEADAAQEYEYSGKYQPMDYPEDDYGDSPMRPLIMQRGDYE